MTAHEAGLGLVAGRTGRHPDVECIRPGLVDVILGAAKAHTGERGETGDPEAFHDKAAAVGANAVLRVLKCTG
jgi:hypothetical protein